MFTHNVIWLNIKSFNINMILHSYSKEVVGDAKLSGDYRLYCTSGSTYYNHLITIHVIYR